MGFTTLGDLVLVCSSHSTSCVFDVDSEHQPCLEYIFLKLSIICHASVPLHVLFLPFGLPVCRGELLFILQNPAKT